MKKNAFINIGDIVVFSDHGGTCRGGVVLGQQYTIKSFKGVPYRTEGHCNAILDNGALMRMSSVEQGRTHGGYTNYFEVVGGSSYEIY